MSNEKDVLVVEPSEELALPAVSATPARLLEIAISKGVDMDQLEKLMAMQERWEANEARKAYAKAISEFRNDCPAIDRTREGHNNKYSGLSETLEAIQPVLSRCGLSHSWKTRQEGSLITVTCIVTHVLGHTESTPMSAQGDGSGNKNAIQAIGSTVAYLERYTLYAILGLSSREMDNDGNAVSQAITEDQVIELAALIHEVGADSEAFFKYMGITRLMDMYASNYDKAVAALERKRVKK